ncbi:MAG TPA: hypothetical protein VFJ58_16145 [Armatimonadota bacterium]|nr:hypothetical protein [Armatimonadota bacterium]
MTLQSTVDSDLGDRARQLYARIRDQIEISENLGKMIVMDVDSGDFEIDAKGIESSRHLLSRHPGARLYALRIGYKSAVSFAGALERSDP